MGGQTHLGDHQISNIDTLFPTTHTALPWTADTHILKSEGTRRPPVPGEGLPAAHMQRLVITADPDPVI
jgi:hypothetical protein